MSEQAPFPEDPFPLLERGTIEGIELIPWGSNYTFAALISAAHLWPHINVAISYRVHSSGYTMMFIAWEKEFCPGC